MSAILLFAAATNLDSFVVGLSYGVRRMHLSLAVASCISLIVTGGTVLAMALGQYLGGWLSPDWTGYLGSGLMLLLGLWCLLGCLLRTEPETTQPRAMGLKETLALGCALSLNNAGLGIGASLVGLGLWETAVLSFCCSLSFFYIGNRLGRRWGEGAQGQTAELLSGLLMIVLSLQVFLG